MAEFWYGVFGLGFLGAFLAYKWALKIRIYAVVDSVWTVGLGVGALSYYLLYAPNSARAIVSLLLLLAWSVRISSHLFRDRIFAGKEDPRYAALATHWGDKADSKFIFLFLGQIPLVALFLLPVTIAIGNDAAGWRWFDTLALLVGVVALFGEYLADHQLAKFRANPECAGKVCREGLWRYSRHPNYFFEWLYWFAYVFFAVGAALGWLAIIGPVMMYVFLRYITGVPFAERSSLRSRGDAYRDYQKTTNVFFPWKPQRDRSS